MLWAPQPGPQSDAICAAWCEELLYGGAAGGGKTDFLLGDYLQDVPAYAAAWQGILFRRSMPELEEMMARSAEIYPQTGAVWREQKKSWYWPNGARLRMRYLEADRDATRYQGGAFPWIGWDELGQHPTPFGYKYLRGRLRSAHPIPRKRIRASANPGGVGHQWLKAKFVTPAPLGNTLLTDPETGGDVLFIRARLQDNHILTANDPRYADRLRGMGSAALVKAWLDGDWDVVAGAFFDEFSVDRHVVRAHTLPDSWPRFRSMDWGSARPFSVNWWAISDGTLPQYPRGALVCYREWYGVKTDAATGIYEPNVGIKLTAEEVGRGIVEREAGERVQNGASVIDPAAFAVVSGPSVAERITIGSGRKVDFRRADNRRVGKMGAFIGWDAVRARLKGDGEGEPPMIFFMDCCPHVIRTLPVLQHDELKPEDVDTEGEDHAADSVRYACMSRPFLPRSMPKKEPVFPGMPIGGAAAPNTRAPTMDDLWKAHERERAGWR